MTEVWETMDQQIAQQTMPQEFANATAHILCNDCEKKSNVSFHFFGLKCAECGSYNTKILSTSGMPQYPINGRLDQNGTVQEVPEEEEEEGEEEVEDIDISELSVRQLKQILDEHGVDYSDCVEKSQFIEKVLQVLTQQQQHHQEERDDDKSEEGSKEEESDEEE